MSLPIYEMKKNTDKWIPVWLSDSVFDEYTGKSSVGYASVTVKYSYEGESNTNSSYTLVTGDWKWSGIVGFYSLNIGASEFTVAQKYMLEVSASGARPFRCICDVRSFLKEEEYTGSNVVTMKYKSIDIHNTDIYGVGLNVTSDAGTPVSFQTSSSSTGLEISSQGDAVIFQSTVTGTGLTLEGTNSEPGLKISSHTGSGILINTQNAHGIDIGAQGSDKHGINVISASGNGIYINAKENGIDITSQGIGLSVNSDLSAAVLNSTGSSDGLSISSVGGIGLSVATGDNYALSLVSNNGSGMIINAPFGKGMYINSGAIGVDINAVSIGVDITSNTTAMKLESVGNAHGLDIIGSGTGFSGVSITSPQGNGISIASGTKGINIESSSEGISVTSDLTALKLYSNTTHVIDIGTGNQNGANGINIESGGIGLSILAGKYGSSSEGVSISAGGGHGIAVGGYGAGSNGIDVTSGSAIALALNGFTKDIDADEIDGIDSTGDFVTVNSKLDTIAGYIDTEVGAIKAKTDNIPSDPADASAIAAEFVAINSKLDTIDTVADAVKVKTDSLTFTVSGKVDSNATNIAGDADAATNLKDLSLSGVRAKVNAVPTSATTIVLKSMSNTSANMNNSNLIKNNTIKFISGACRGQTVGISAQTASATEPYTFTVTPMVNWSGIQIDDDVVIT